MPLSDVKINNQKDNEWASKLVSKFKQWISWLGIGEDEHYSPASLTESAVPDSCTQTGGR